MIHQIKCRKIPIFKNDEYKRAESRQCYSALFMYDKLPQVVPLKEIIFKEKMKDYLQSFNWNEPWGAGSHYSHMLFFQRMGYVYGLLTQEEYNENISYAKTWIDNIQDKESGSWFIGKTTSQQAINGAMKVLSGFNAVGDLKISEETGQKLIDLCLNNVNNDQACDNFNIIYVLKNAIDVCRDYRKNEIIDFAEKRFNIYMDYYYPEWGGFSFYKGKSNECYYGCRITRGKDEPDIHGTTLFMWGMAVISKILGIDKEAGLREFIT